MGFIILHVNPVYFVEISFCFLYMSTIINNTISFAFSKLSFVSWQLLFFIYFFCSDYLTDLQLQMKLDIIKIIMKSLPMETYTSYLCAFLRTSETTDSSFIHLAWIRLLHFSCHPQIYGCIPCSLQNLRLIYLFIQQIFIKRLLWTRPCSRYISGIVKLIPKKECST